MSTAQVTWQAHVDAQLMEQGAFAPLELLFNCGRLVYDDYAAWRRREIDLLDGVLMGSPDKIRLEVEQAATYARSIGLVEQPQDFHAWNVETSGDTDRPLRLSTDPQLQRLLGSRYVPAQKAPQMDLFFDNPIVALTNGIVRAVSRRDLGETQRQLDRLYTQAPNHSELAAFDQLLAALGHLQHPDEDPRQELSFILGITPTAKRLMGSLSRDVLSPLWQQLAHLLENRLFTSDEPLLHRSYALTQAQDWRGVRESILAESQWWLHAALCERMVQSGYQRRQRAEALAAWCHLCWRAPEQADGAVDRLRQSDLTGLWQRFGDIEAECADLDQSTDLSLTPADFPAWLLLFEQGLAQTLSADLPTGDTPAEECFRCVNRWIHARRHNKHLEEISLRKVLQASHPTLFRLLKSTAQTHHA
jgi:hypothetical protein